MKFEQDELISNIEGRVKRLRAFLQMENKRLILKEIKTIQEYLGQLAELVR